MKKLSFSHITFSDLERLVDIRQVVDDTVFDEWFNYNYVLKDCEERLLADLVADLHQPASRQSPILPKVSHS